MRCLPVSTQDTYTSPVRATATAALPGKLVPTLTRVAGDQVRPPSPLAARSTSRAFGSVRSQTT